MTMIEIRNRCTAEECKLVELDKRLRYVELFPILFLDSKRGQNGCNRLQDDGIEVAAMQPLLLGQRLDHNGSDIRLMHCHHRLMILAMFSKPRLAK
jgi:hypothetical protein